MERSLYQNDADFVATVSQRRGRPNYTLLVVGLLIAVAGIATLIIGVVVRQPLVGVLGFAVMFGGALLAFAPPRKNAAPAASSTGRAKKTGPGKSNTSFMDRLNERWDRREEGRD
jgi:hypothetical protein